MYRQPDDAAGQHRSKSYQLSQAFTKLENTLDELEGISNIILCGDFNVPNINWSENEPNQSQNSLATIIKSIQNKYLLTQMVKDPTHKSGNTLDLIFTNNKQLFNEIHSIPTSRSDHHIIEVSTHFKSHFARSQSTRRQFNNVFDSLNFFSEDVDWEQIKTELNDHNWNEEFSQINDPVDKLNHLIKTCELASIAHVPQKRIAISRKSKIPRDRRVLMRRRRKIIKRLPRAKNKSTTNKLTTELIEIEMKLQASFERSTTYQEDKAIQAIKRNPKYFFTYVKKFNKVKPAIGPLLDKNNQYIVENLDMANLLSAQYSSVFSTPKDAPIDPNTLFDSEEDGDLKDINFTPDDIKKAISDIAANAAPGPDGFPAILLRNCKEELAQPLHQIWRECLDLGITPPSLKFSRIIPIHKGDSTALPKNYRPVALTSHLVKLFEKILRSKIVNHLEKNNLCNATQHGFRSGRSCLSQLLAHYDKILSLLDQGMNVDIIYLDFAKAFDKLDFNITLKKLKHLGITGKIGKWIHSFLTNRTQSVVVNGEQSSPAPVISGVPQGSVIGPLLFLVLIGDIDKDVSHAFLSSFADDTRIGIGISTEEDVNQLQEDLEKVYEWAIENNMLFNDTKFEALRYGQNSNIKQNTEYVSNTGQQIKCKTSIKDLGVTMSTSSDFNEHIHNITETVKDLIAWILRSFKSRSKSLMLQLWKSIVIPHLDYCSQLWNPSKSYLINQLEELQKYFVKRISGYRDKDYITALKELGLYSLQRRRERYQIIYLWSILESSAPNIESSNNEQLIKVQSLPQSRRGRTIAIKTLKNSRIANLRYASLPFHGARLFNILPKELRNLSGCSKMVFKSKLDSHLKKLNDHPLLPVQILTHQAPANSILNQSKKRWDESDLVVCS